MDYQGVPGCVSLRIVLRLRSPVVSSLLLITISCNWPACALCLRTATKQMATLRLSLPVCNSTAHIMSRNLVRCSAIAHMKHCMHGGILLSNLHASVTASLTSCPMFFAKS